MGFRFQRRIPIGSGLRLSFSKSGVSATVGTRGAHVTFGPRGTRTTVGLPGSGLSYTSTQRSGASAFELVLLAALLFILFFAI